VGEQLYRDAIDLMLGGIDHTLVLIAEEKASPRRHAGDLHHFGGIITYIPMRSSETSN
jgi:hypothetical protein